MAHATSDRGDIVMMELLSNWSEYRKWMVNNPYNSLTVLEQFFQYCQGAQPTPEKLSEWEPTVENMEKASNCVGLALRAKRLVEERYPARGSLSKKGLRKHMGLLVQCGGGVSVCLTCLSPV
jgi:hypothetical protein